MNTGVYFHRTVVSSFPIGIHLLYVISTIYALSCSYNQNYPIHVSSAMQDTSIQLLNHHLHANWRADDAMQLYHGLDGHGVDRRRAATLLYEYAKLNSTHAERAKIFLGVMAKRNLPHVEHLPRGKLMAMYDMFVGCRDDFEYWDDIEEMMVDPKQTWCAFSRRDGALEERCDSRESDIKTANFRERNSQPHLERDVKSLYILDWASKRLTCLPKEIGLCTELQAVDCSSNQLSELPRELTDCTQLRYLDVFDNRLTGLPAHIGQCEHLEYLDCGNNIIPRVPPDIGCCVRLTFFYLVNNQICKLPQELGNCSSLQCLECDNNHIKTIPEELAKCSKLWRISCSKSAVETLPVAMKNKNGLITEYW